MNYTFEMYFIGIEYRMVGTLRDIRLALVRDTRLTNLQVSMILECFDLTVKGLQTSRYSAGRIGSAIMELIQK